jgi:hypothetical protein
MRILKVRGALEKTLTHRPAVLPLPREREIVTVRGFAGGYLLGSLAAPCVQAYNLPERVTLLPVVDDTEPERI